MRFLLVLIILFSCEKQNIEFKISGKALGTIYNITFLSNTVRTEQVEKIKLEINNLFIQFNSEMSTYHKNTEIMNFNHAKANTNTPISKDFQQVMEAALKISRETSGAFDVTVGPLIELWGFGRKKELKKRVDKSRLDSVQEFISYQKIVLNKNNLIKEHDKLAINLNAIAKGYAVDKLAKYIEQLGVENYLVEIGGEVRCKGKNKNNEFWKIGINSPDLKKNSKRNFKKILSLKNVSMATSGDYENYYVIDGKYYSHTIDPRTLSPIRHNLASVTVIAKNCMLADAYATAFTVMGKDESIAFLSKRDDLEAYFIIRNDDGSFNEFFTEGFSDYLLKD